MKLSIAEEDRFALRPLLASATIELIPTKGAADRATVLSEGTKVSVTASPKTGPEATLELAAELVQQRLHVTAHLSAKQIRDRTHLESIVERLDDLGIDELFVVGGDGAQTGCFSDAWSLLQELENIGRPFSRIGVGCYPEGHPMIPNDVLLRSLRQKQALATHMTSQMCFDVDAIADWTRLMRSEGVHLPLHVGLPGVVDPIKLVRISARIGVGQSLRFVAKNKRLAAGLIRPGGYDPSDLVRSLVPAIVDPDVNIAGFHIFTFNQVAATEKWRQALIA